MKCITPMVRMYDARAEEYKKASGEDIKVWQHIVPRSQVYDRLSQDHNYLRKVQDKNEELERKGSPLRYQLIPCKNCFACQLKYSAEWAARIMWECRRSEHNYFITITYDEEHLPIYESFKYIDQDGQEEIYQNDGTWSGTLEPEDMTRFINSLRKYFERKGIKDIKYFYCGEYGNQVRNSMGFRPHYHMILMNCPLDITQFYDTYLDNKQKKFHWKSKELDRLWKKGMIDVGEVEFNSAAYVARYCMKKLMLRGYYNKQDYAKNGKIPEFIRMSRRPGIGMRYYDENKEKIYENDNVILKTIHNNTAVFKPPKAFDNKFKEQFPERWAEIQESRQAASERNRKLIEELQKGISDMELLQREAEKVTMKANMLDRVNTFD